MTPAIILAAAIVCTSPFVYDGDTMTCNRERVRLFAIDAPEIRQAQPNAQAAKSRLHSLTRGQVTCTPAGNKRDRYGRTVARCWSNGIDVGAQLIREGLACRYIRYDVQRIYVGLGRECGR
jgi:micrococcal nuclease